MRDKKNLLSAVVLLSCGCILFLVCATIWELFSQTELLPTLKILADCCTVPAVVFLGVSVIGWIGSKGTFDIFGYSIGGLFQLFRRDAYLHGRETFYDYRVKKDKNRKPFNLPMLAVGLLFLLAAGALTVAFLILE